MNYLCLQWSKNTCWSQIVRDHHADKDGLGSCLVFQADALPQGECQNPIAALTMGSDVRRVYETSHKNGCRNGPLRSKHPEHSLHRCGRTWRRCDRGLGKVLFLDDVEKYVEVKRIPCPIVMDSNWDLHETTFTLVMDEKEGQRSVCNIGRCCFLVWQKVWTFQYRRLIGTSQSTKFRRP